MSAALEFRAVDILFCAKAGRRASAAAIQQALAALDAGSTRAEIAEKTGVVVGVADASLSVERGAISVLMGLSGSGKSTLLRAANGLNLVTRGQVLVGGYYFEAEVLRFSLGYAVPSQLFDDCGTNVPVAPNAIYLLNSEHTLAAAALTAVGAPLLARVVRPDDAFLVFGAASTPTLDNGSADTPACRERWR